MKTLTLLIMIGAMSIHSTYAQEYPQIDSNTRLSGPYFGLEPPGQTAKVFAPGIVSTELYELFSAFTPDMKEFYFVRYDTADKASMIVYTYENNKWKSSVAGPRVGEPFISPDGQTMHLGKRYMERTDSGWSALKSLGEPYSEMRIMRLTASSTGTYYFDTAGEEPIRYSKVSDGKREEPKTLNIDLGKNSAHPFIAPDESWLIWDDQRETGYGRADIYISFKQEDDSWGPAINMGRRVNTEESDSYATITPDGKYMLFNRRIHEDNVDIYWVDAKIIETLRADARKFPILEGSYMGQKPPGMVAEPFAPGIISTDDWEVEGTFSPDMKEFYFTASSNEPFRPIVIGFHQQDNVWKKFIEFPRRGEISFSPDGQRMYMADGYKDRTDGGWSERKSLGSSFEGMQIMRLSASAKETYVFDEIGMPNGDGIIRYSRLIDGRREEPKPFSVAINTGRMNAHPFIAPDESYLIWDGEREDGYGDSDLYISFKQEDGTWGAAINMGESINTDKWEAFGSVTADGKYFLFNRGIDDENDNVDIYWVDAKIIDTLKPQ
ncbi:MAG: hypothetical protein AAF391_05455 [Bacteroidota bacterium]